MQKLLIAVCVLVGSTFAFGTGFSRAHAQEMAAVVAATNTITHFQSFGGRIVAVYPFCLNGGEWVDIEPAGGDPNPFYIYTPATILETAEPPSHSGQEILGLADTAYICVVNYFPYIQMPPGQRMQIVGASL